MCWLNRVDIDTIRFQLVFQSGSVRNRSPRTIRVYRELQRIPKPSHEHGVPHRLMISRFIRTKRRTRSQFDTRLVARGRRLALSLRPFEYEYRFTEYEEIRSDARTLNGIQKIVRSHFARTDQQPGLSETAGGSSWAKAPRHWQ